MKLEDINKENIFKVPENYFEDFPDRLQKRIAEANKSKKTPVIRLRMLINIAAAAAILIFAVYGINQMNKQTASPDQLLSDISTEELIIYLMDSDISTDELLETMDVSIIASNDYPFIDDIVPFEPLDEETIDELLEEYEIEMQYL